MTLNAKQFQKTLVALGACSEGREFARGKTLAEIWNTLERADWMLWLIVKKADELGWPTKKTVRLAICDCAATALPIYKKYYPDDTRPAEAIKIARKYANGKATEAQLAAAKEAAGEAAKAATRETDWEAAGAAAWEAAGEAAKAAARETAWEAAGEAAWAAAGAADWEAAGETAWAAAGAAAGAAAREAARVTARAAARVAARAAAHKKMCALIRKRIPVVGGGLTRMGDEMKKNEAVIVLGRLGLSRKQAVKLVDQVGALNCEPTNRVLEGNDDRMEWTASVQIPGTDGAQLTAYYYTTPEDEQIVADNGGDWGGINWEIDHYLVQ